VGGGLGAKSGSGAARGLRAPGCGGASSACACPPNTHAFLPIPPPKTNPSATPVTPLESREGDVYQVDKADMHGVWEVSNIIEPQT
jgi:hypothetical protein